MPAPPLDRNPAAPAASLRPVRRTIRRAALTFCLTVTLGACMVGPDYRRPTVETPSRFKETGPPPGWQTVSPANAALPKGPWWTIYGDRVLDDLEAQVAVSNQTLAVDEANYRQAIALIDEARGQLFPVIGLTPSFQRSGTGSSGIVLPTGSGLTGGTGGTTSTSTTAGVTTGGLTTGANGTGATGTTSTSGIGSTGILSGERDTNTLTLQGDVSWDLDLWGRIRRQIESNVATAQADAALVVNARLSIEAELATSYFELRASDSLQRLLDRTVAVYQRNLVILHNQATAGTAQPSDELQAITQLRETQASAASVGAARASYEHAIAVFTGHTPASLVIAPGDLQSYVPEIPAGVPSALLQRRPDIAEAERQADAANAAIGVEIAAFYPDISLSASGGFAGPDLGTLLHTADRFWSLGVAASQTLFEGGIRSAAVIAAEEQYDAAVANYRGTVLAAFQGVEDQLANLQHYDAQQLYQRAAVTAANRTVEIAFNEYEAGTQAYTTVVTAQATALGDAQNEISIQQTRLTSSVALIEALGGNWTDTDLPDRNFLQRSDPLIPAFLEGRDPRLAAPATGPLYPP